MKTKYSRYDAIYHDIDYPYDKGERLMEFGKSVLMGFTFGVGLVLASAFMRVALKMSLCN